MDIHPGGYVSRKSVPFSALRRVSTALPDVHCLSFADKAHRHRREESPATTARLETPSTERCATALASLVWTRSCATPGAATTVRIETRFPVAPCFVPDLCHVSVFQPGMLCADGPAGVAEVREDFRLFGALFPNATSPQQICRSLPFAALPRC